MNFQEWHGPVPLVPAMGVFERCVKFLQLGQPMRRLNWTMTVYPRLDTSPEQYPHWGRDRAMVTPANAGDLAHLRVELQSLWRLPRSNAICVQYSLLSAEFAGVGHDPEMGPAIAPRTEKPPLGIGRLQGPLRYRDTVVGWLARYDDGVMMVME